MSKDEADAARGSGEITRLLHAWHEGHDGARDDLWPIVYGELKRLAGSVLRDRGGARQEATSLVHKAYLRLLGSDVDWQDRRHFFAIAARAMRFVLADEARRRVSSKRGRDETLSLDENAVGAVDPLAHQPEEVLAVHQAMEKLGKVNPRHVKLVEMRYFAGLSVEETAQVLEVTARTVLRDWKTVRVWLHGELRGTA